MKRCMLDLETLGTNPGCIILSIGAVMFDETTGKLGHEFYMEINQNSCSAAGLVDDPATLKWWNSQPEAAKKILANTAGDKGAPLSYALACFTDWLVHNQLEAEDVELGPDFELNTEIWACGSDFDTPILTAAYHALGGKVPWKFWNNRCYRTMKSIFPLHKLTRVGTHHNALDDAKSQAHHVIQILRAVLPQPAEPKTLWQSIKEWIKRESRWAP